ncbi:OsmC family protein [Methylobacterium planeticum]|uniref:OsmC family protein n=1 Tax=Methylobacterium planeticum TaxID=2615211 RepID=A0A6N6MU25_9HYPH|nr:OsmC family protein [Methylobacterium planeticum]KAB1072253.1 OsmC family protein [Methylobacterium planeticum]
MASSPSITIKQVDNYKFTVDFGSLIPELLVDEAIPIGRGEGPFPEQLLVAGVANCLCASLVFALGKYKQDAQGVVAEATCAVERNAEGRLRITGIDVAISLGADAGALDRLDKVLAQFERFCTVSESVKVGIPVAVSVRDSQGVRLK